MDVVALLVLLVCYVCVMLVGIFASRWFKKKHSDASDKEIALVAARRLSGLVGMLTMIATTVGGGFINGTAESVAKDGLIWTVPPFAICLGLTIGGLVYARRMREKCYLTMLDPFQLKYGRTVVGLLYLTAAVADICWSAAILAALGTSLSVLVKLDVNVSIIISACVAIFYTFFGQMVAVAYTDIIQLVLITLGLVVCLPFALTNENVRPLSTTSDIWLGSGSLNASNAMAWLDFVIAMIFGTIPWQSYFQRVLSLKSAGQAQIFSVVAGVGSLIFAVPPFLIGAIAASTNWNATELGRDPVATNEAPLVLPYVLYYLTPRAVAITGLGGIAAAVMSSVDSAVLASGSQFAHNIYHNLFRRTASDKELIWAQRVSICVIGVISTVMAIFIHSIFGLFVMAGDLIFVIMFPQLTAVIFFKYSNAYGSVCGYVLGVVLRVGAGEPYLNMKPFIHYPMYTEEYGQAFPFRTLAMVCSFLVILLVSYTTRFLFVCGVLPEKLDILQILQDELAEDEESSEEREERIQKCVDFVNQHSSETVQSEILDLNSCDENIKHATRL